MMNDQNNSKGKSLINSNFILLTICLICPVTVTSMFFLFSSYLSAIRIDSGSIGMIVSADALSALVVQFLISPFINTGNAKKWLVPGILFFYAGLLTIGTSRSFVPLVSGRMLQGAGMVIILSALIALLVHFIPPKKSGSAFSFLSFIRLVPFAAVPMLFELNGISAPHFTKTFPLIYCLAVLPIIAVFIKTGRSSTTAKTNLGMQALKHVFQSRPILFTMLSTFFLFTGYSAVFYYIKSYGEHIGLHDAGLFLTFETAGMLVIRLMFAGIFDRYDKVKLIVIGIITSMISYILIPVVGSSVLFFVLAGICGFGWGVAMPLQNAYLFDIPGNTDKAVSQNLMSSMMQAGFFVGTLTGSHVIGLGGYTVFFVYVFFMTMFAAVAQMMSRSEGEIHARIS